MKFQLVDSEWATIIERAIEHCATSVLGAIAICTNAADLGSQNPFDHWVARRGIASRQSHLASMQYKYLSDRSISCPSLTAGLPLKSLSSDSRLCATCVSSDVASNM